MFNVMNMLSVFEYVTVMNTNVCYLSEYLRSAEYVICLSVICKYIDWQWRVCYLSILSVSML